MKTLNDQNGDLGYTILKVLEEHYSCAEEILNKLRKRNIEFNERKLYPVLSGLVLQNYLCCNWLENDKGLPIKHYHLTRSGFKFLQK